MPAVAVTPNLGKFGLSDPPTYRGACSQCGVATYSEVWLGPTEFGRESVWTEYLALYFSKEVSVVERMIGDSL